MRSRFLLLLLLHAVVFISCEKSNEKEEVTDYKQFHVQAKLEKKAELAVRNVKQEYEILLTRFKSKQINFQRFKDSARLILLGLKDINKVGGNKISDNLSQSQEVPKLRLENKFDIFLRDNPNPWTYTPGPCPYPPEQTDLCQDLFYSECIEHCDVVYYSLVDDIMIREQGAEQSYLTALQACDSILDDMGLRALCIQNAENEYIYEMNALVNESQSVMLEYLMCTDNCSMYS